jgi:photosystem II stability/assembly factor-like uncharacterized protein
MDIRDELHDALDAEQFSSPALLARVMSRLDTPPRAKRQQWAPLIAAVLTIAIVLTLVVVRASMGGITTHGPAGATPTAASGPTLPVSSSVTGETSYRFVSPEVGWLSVSTGESNTQTVIAKTADGGQTWQRQLSFSGPFTLSPPPMQFFSANDGVVSGQDGGFPTVWRTADGGATWQAHQVPTSSASERFVSASFVDAQHGWVLTSHTNFAPPSNSGPALVYRTTDGANTWTQVGTLPATKLVWLNISFAGASDGYITTSAGYANSQAWTAPLPLLATHDAGATWTNIDLPAPPPGAFIEALLSFSAGAGILIVEANRVDACPSQPGCFSMTPAGRYLYSTADWGRTWTGPQSIAHGYVDVIDPSRWLTLNAGGFAVSTDGGKTWSASQAFTVPSGWFATEAQFLDAQRGFITLSSSSEGNFQGLGAYGPSGKSAVVYTSDGGSTWQSVRLATGG